MFTLSGSGVTWGGEEGDEESANAKNVCLFILYGGFSFVQERSLSNQNVFLLSYRIFWRTSHAFLRNLHAL